MPKIRLGRLKSKNKTPAHYHHPMFPIWYPLWRSIQHPHVSSLHMSTTKRETPLPLQSVEKTETRCNTPTGSALLIGTKMVCVCVRVCLLQWRTFQSTKVTLTVPSAFKYWKICDRACHWSQVNVISSVPMALCTNLISTVRQCVLSSGNKYKCVWRR